MDYDYDLNTSIEVEKSLNEIQILTNSFSGDIKIKQHAAQLQKLQYAIADSVDATYPWVSGISG